MRFSMGRRAAHAPAQVLKLDRGRSSRVGAAICAVLLFLTSLGWLLFCLLVPTGPDAAPDAGIVIRLMALGALPIFRYAVAFTRDAFATGDLTVTTDEITLRLPHTLRRPIHIDRECVSGAIVDACGAANNDERLRFPVPGGSYLYSSVAGSALPYLGFGPGIPNVAVVLNRPIVFEEARRRRIGLSEYEPVRPLQPDVPVLGLLVRVHEPEQAEAKLNGWLDPSRARTALLAIAEQYHPEIRGPGDRGSPVRRPLDERAVRRATWLSWLGLIGLVVAFVVLGRHGRYTTGREALLLVGFALMLVGGFIDTRLRYQERRGPARVASLALTGLGIGIALVVTALSGAHT
jgi:hypothetical protein